MNIFLCILLLYPKMVFSQDVVKIHNCMSEEEAYKFPSLRFKEFKMDAVIKDDAITNAKFAWDLYDTRSNNRLTTKEPYDRDNIFDLWPFDIMPGLYRIVSTITIGGTLLASTTCYLYIKAHEPMAIIRGGVERVVRSDQRLSVDGGLSVDLDAPPNDGSDLTYEWTCSQKTGNTFCENFKGAGQHLGIPRIYVTKAEEFDIVLKISTSSGLSNSVHQKITVADNVANLVIECEKNCKPHSRVSNFRLKTFLIAFCIENCFDFNEEILKWRVTDKNGNEKSIDKLLSRKTGSLFAFSEKSVNSPQVLLAEVTDGSGGKSVFELNYAEPPSGWNCAINPTSGVSLKTKFRLDCSGFADGDTYWVGLYLDQESDQLIISAPHSTINELQFYLPAKADSKYAIKVTDSKKLFSFKEITANVEIQLSELKPEEVVERIRSLQSGDAKRPSLTELLRCNRKKEALQIAQNIVIDLKNLRSQEPLVKQLVQNLKVDLSVDMLKAPIEMVDDIVHASMIMANLVDIDKNETTEKGMRLTSTMCRKVATRLYQGIAIKRFPMNWENAMNIVLNNVLNCLDFEVRDLEPEDYENAISETSEKTSEETDKKRKTKGQRLLRNSSVESVEYIDEPTIPEDYPDYKDLTEEALNKLSEREEFTYNVIRSMNLMIDSIEKTIAHGQKVEQVTNAGTNILILKNDGANLGGKELKSQNSSIVLPKAFNLIGDDHVVVQVVTWKQDLMKWNPKKTYVKTNIIDISIRCGGGIIKHFTEPLMISFTGLQPIKNDIISEEFLPSEEIRIRRVSVRVSQAIIVNFDNLGSQELYAILLENEFPLKEQVNNGGILINSGTTSITYRNQKDYNTWCYLGVVPKTENELLSYNVSFTVSSCLQWSSASRSWQATCKPGENISLERIDCYCDHASVFAGESTNARSIPQRQQVSVFLLELHRNDLIFIWVAVCFALYCLLLLFFLDVHPKEVYFLGDNLKNELYAYFLIIKTEYHPNAGTTSNIGIKLNGTKGHSSPHVLNYPDPERRLLRRLNEDWFVLTTPTHLGTIKSVELWFDSVGNDPSWYCDTIIIFDLQLEIPYIFHVHRQLNVRHRIAYIKCEEIEMEKNDKLLRKIAFKEVFFEKTHTWNFKSKDRLTYFKRLTIILSTILTMNALNLLFIGLPAVRRYDVFDYGHYKFGFIEVLKTIASSVISFGVHISLAWIFRNSSQQFPSFLSPTLRFTFTVTVITWTVLASLIVASITLLVVFGFWMPTISSYLWLTSILLAIVVDIILYEHIVIAVKKILTPGYSVITGLYRDYFVQIIRGVERQRHILYTKFGKNLLRPYFQHLYNPLKDEIIEQKRYVEDTREAIWSQLQDLFMFIVYIIILFNVVLVDKVRFSYPIYAEMNSMMTGKHTRTIDFFEVNNIQQYYQFLNETLVPVVHPLIWYHNFAIHDAGSMVDFSTKYLGVVRLRQQRVTDDSCEVTKQMRFLHLICKPEYTRLNADFEDYSIKWSQNFELAGRLKEIWKYQNAIKSGAVDYTGNFARYRGGGYIAPLGRTETNTVRNLQYMRRNKWMDGRTRAIFLEVLAYNANYNIFVAVKLLFEQSATGYFFKHTEMLPVRMLFLHTEVEQMSFIMFILFVIWVLLLFLRRTQTLVKKWKTYFKSFWLVMDLVILLLSVVCIIMYAVRIAMVEEYLKELEGLKHNIFVDYFKLFYIQYILTMFAAFLVCMTTIRLWNLLRFYKIFKVVEKTIISSVSQALALLVYYSVLLAAYALFGWMIFGENCHGFDTFGESVKSILFLTIQLYDYYDYTCVTGVTFKSYAPIFFMSFAYWTLVVFFLFTAIIMRSYTEAIHHCNKNPDTYTLKDYLVDEYDNYSTLFKFRSKRLKGGARFRTRKARGAGLTLKERKQLQVFTDEEIASINKSKLDAMCFIVKCFFRNKRQTMLEKRELTSAEVNLILKTCAVVQKKKKYTKGDAADFFYQGYIKRRAIFIHFDRFTLMRKIVDIVTGKDDEYRQVDAKRYEELRACKNLIMRGNSTLKACLHRLLCMQARLSEFDIDLSSASK